LDEVCVGPAEVAGCANASAYAYRQGRMKPQRQRECCEAARSHSMRARSAGYFAVSARLLKSTSDAAAR
jgi:hypothetical protein